MFEKLIFQDLTPLRARNIDLKAWICKHKHNKGILAAFAGIVVFILPRPEGTKFKISGDVGQEFIQHISSHFTIVTTEKKGGGYIVEAINPGNKEATATFLKDKAAQTKMADIRVVPNPYVATNMMEPSVVNKYLNQSRRLLFTNLPAQSTIKIFTISGMLVRELHAPEDGLTSYNGLGDSNTGVLHWDMISWEGLEIAAGMYFYHVKDDMTGEEKTGKFAVIK